MKWLLGISLLLFIPFSALSQTEHTLVRRVSVFPLKVPKEFSTKAEETWWELREALTKDRRFLIASKTFLVQKDVYQPRGALTPADAIILGKLLDANALMTTYLEERTLTMKVYEGDYGRPLWEQQLNLQPSVPINDQLAPATLKLARDFLASIPYQGFVVIDPLKGEPLFKEGRFNLVKADVGENSEVEIGDPAQLIRITSDHLKPLFTHGAAIEVYAEGRVVGKDRETITIEVSRLTQAAAIKEGSLVRLPKELKRLELLYAMPDSLRNKIDPEILSTSMTPMQQEVEEHIPLIASLTWILNFAAFLLLAF